MQRAYIQVTDSNPVREWELIQFERAQFRLPNGIERKISGLVERLRDTKGAISERADLMAKVNALLRTGDLCFRFSDGRLSRGLLMNKWTNKGSARKPVHFDLVKSKDHRNADNRGLKHPFEIVPFPQQRQGITNHSCGTSGQEALGPTA